MKLGLRLTGFPLVCALLFMALGQLALAQIDTGAIVGVVLDSSGAAVPDATVVVTNTATNVAFTTRTNTSGQYQFVALIPGVYSVKVTVSGFQAAIRDKIVIDVQSRAAADFNLQVGQSTEVMQVTSATPVLQTESADVGGVVAAKQISDLPLNGRRYSDLTLLEAGITKNYSVSNYAADRYNSNGNWDTQNYFSMDGVDNNSGSENLQEGSVQVIQPPPDALQEFRVQTRTYSAEFGTSAGAVVNASIKSGTNQIHGNVWEFLRNSDMDANLFFNNASGVARPHYVQNQFGGTVGGPIKKNRTFFFGDTQVLRARQGKTTLATVPTPLMQTGNFTELTTTLKNPLLPSQAGCVSGNIISPACIDPVGAKLLTLFPSPNIAARVAVQGRPASWAGLPNYSFTYSAPTNNISWDTRVDHIINDKNRIFGRFSSYNTDTVTGAPWTSNLLAGNGTGTQSVDSFHGVALAWDFSVSPTALNELRGGFNREDSHNISPNAVYGQSAAAQYGLNGIPQGPYTTGIPPIYITGMTTLGVTQYKPQTQISQVWQLIDNYSWLKGNHSFKIGYESRHTSDNFLDIRAPQGQMLVGGTSTSPGFGLSDFVLGDIDQIYLTTPTIVHNYMIGHSFYGQDTWRIRPNLTITVGLRYELFSPVLNHQNQVANFTPANGGGLIYPASNCSGWSACALVNTNKNNFAPRLGFSYHPLSRVVFRGGYGIFYQHAERIGSESMMALNPPFLINENLVQPTGTPNPVFQLKNGFPQLSTTVNLANLQLRVQNPNQPTSYVEQVSFGPEIQLSQNTALDISYTGNFARRMLRLRNANQAMVSFDASGNEVLNFPYPNLNSGSQHAYLEYAANDGNANYDGLLVSLRRRYEKALTYGVSYTWSHSLADFVDNLTNGTNAIPENSYNYSAEKSNSYIDIRQRFVGYLTYGLPFGKGQTFLNKGGVVDAVLGGWQANTVVTAQTGAPYTVTAPDETGSGTNQPRPNCISNPYVGTNSDPRIGPLIAFSAFALPAKGTFGNCASRGFHGPGLQNVDLSLFKSFSLGETRRIEFRAEAFNFLNHANFANPNSAYSASAGGVFGRVTATLPNTTPRDIQLALKLYF
jgi:hypothetical protein